MSDQLFEPAAAKYGNAIVRFYQGSSVAGTGFRISDRYIMTCAHVVSQCLGLGKDPEKVSAEQVQEKLSKKSLEINFACDGEGKVAPKFAVEVVSQLWRWDGEDIAIVRLKKDPPSGSVEIELATVQEPYLNHIFYVYGFPDGHGESGLETTGEMLCKNIANKRIQIEGKKDQGVSIRPGYSGAPVWDCTIGGVRGMAVASVKEEDEALETQKVKIGFMIPADRLNPAVKVIQLFELLFPHEKQLENHWKDAYNWAEPVGSSMGRTDASLKTWKEAIVQLFQLPTAGIKFVAYLIVVLQDLALTTVKQNLEEWLKNTVSLQEYSTLLEVAAQEYQILKNSKVKDQVMTSHLLFWVQSDLNQPKYTIKADFVEDSLVYRSSPDKDRKGFKTICFKENVSESNIKQILQECLDLIGDKIKGCPQLDIFLSSGNCTWEIDQWEMEMDDPESPLMGCEYNVVLHLEDRWRKSKYIYKWREKLDTFENEKVHYFICGNEKKRPQLRQALKKTENSDPVGLVLSDGNPSKDTFIAAIEAGIPIILWSRKAIDTNNLTEPTLGECFTSLIQNIKYQREQGYEQKLENIDHFGQHLGVIFDDIKLLPPDVLPLNPGS